MSKQGNRSPIRTKGLGLGGLTGSRLMPYLVAPAISFSAMPVALLAHWQWGQDGVMIAVMAAGSTLLVGTTYVMWERRHQHTRNAATVFAAAVLGWTVFAAASNPLSHAMVQSWILGGILVSAVWGIRHAALSPHHESDKATAGKDGLMDKIGSLKGGTVKKVDEKPGRVAPTIQLPRGEGTAADVQMDRDRIASAVGMGSEEVTVTGVPGDASQVNIAFQTTESLKKSVGWPGASAPGESIAYAPLRFGQRASGAPMELWIVGNDDPENPRPLPHTLVTGVNGSGKTETWKTLVTEMRWRTDVVPCVAGPEGKVSQDFGPIRDAFGIFVLGDADVEQFIRNIPDAVSYRQGLFGSLTRSDGTIGYSQWEPEVYTLHGVPLLSIDLEEAADFLSGNDEFDEGIRKARSAGMSLTASMQTAIHSNIERKTRGQFTNSLVHGCVEQYDARFALSSGTMEKGADPCKWRNNYPGSLYGELVGTDQETWAEEGRAFYLSRSAMRAELDASKAAGYWAEMDEGTRQLLTRGLGTGGSPAGPETDDDEEETETVSMIRTTAEGDVIDVDQALSAPQYELEFPKEESRLTTEQARDLLEQKIDALEAAGKTEITYNDLADFPPPPEGRSKAWVYGELARLVEAGRLTQNSGKPPYRIRARILNGRH